MKKIGTAHDRDEGEVWHWRLSREDYERAAQPRCPTSNASRPLDTSSDAVLFFRLKFSDADPHAGAVLM